MSEVVAELATFEISKDLMKLVDIKGVLSKFRDNYNKLGDLKKFRTEYEKRTALGRLWHRGDLKNAQLSAAEVQADFSQTIGQLLMISIMQSKMLSDQQTVLNDQQMSLKAQADCIEAHTAKIEAQHVELKEQSEKLKNLVKEYFDLRGLTEEGAEKLVRIAKEVKATKQDMVAQFDSRVVEVMEVSNRLIQKVDEQRDVVDEYLKRNALEVSKELRLLRDEVLNSKAQVESTLHGAVGSVRMELGRISEISGGQFASLALSHQKRLLHPRYLTSALQGASIRAQILGRAKHAINQSSINQKDVAGFTIQVPPIQHQRQFADRMTCIDKQTAHQQLQLNRFEALSASLQHRAFRGEL